MTDRDGYTHEVIKSTSKRNKRDEKDDPAFQNEPLPDLKRIQNRSIYSVTTNLKSKKEEKQVKSGKAKSDFKEKTSNIGTGNKLVTTKPWFSKSKILKSERKSFEMNSIYVASVSYEVHPSEKTSISPSIDIYDSTDNVPIHYYKEVYQQSILSEADICAQE